MKLDLARCRVGLEISTPLAPGDVSEAVRWLQEWLCLEHLVTGDTLAVAIDGQYGPATRAAVRQSQAAHGLDVTGVCDPAFYRLLTTRMRDALNVQLSTPMALGLAVCQVAQAHAQAHPLEVGGQNAGPWVRLYMNGLEGDKAPWCSGSATFWLQQAADALGVPAPLPHIFGCDTLGETARQKGLLVRGERRTELGFHDQVPPGSLFLLRRPDNANSWHHTGIMMSYDSEGDIIHSIEGNTNDGGSREGYKATERLRKAAGLDFISIR